VRVMFIYFVWIASFSGKPTRCSRLRADERA
jgi:hypothetical protein